LAEGVSLVPVVVGLYGFAELMLLVEDRAHAASRPESVKMRDLLPTRTEWKRAVPSWLRGTFLGFLFGLVPGPAATLASFASYRLEKATSKHGSEIGSGAIEGVAGPEAANNSAATASLVPLLALGIPFTPIAALMISAMLVQGIQPGPLLITQHPEIFWGLIASAYIGNVMLLALNIPMVGVWVSLLRIPHYLFIPLLLVLSVIGTYSVRNSIFDVWVLLAAGIVGYAFNKMKFQLAPLVVGLILGPNIEKHFREALFLSQGDPWIYVESPIAITVWLLVAAILIAGFIARRRAAFADAMAQESSL
jgi:putative tricarboxylic transport membrane protein